MTRTLLHYIFDPLCGWCYGAAPLIQVLRDIDGLTIQLHGGGMMSGANVQPVTEQLRNFVMHHDQRIAQLSGQPFGEDYFNKLLRDHTAVFDSTPPIAAILAAEAMNGKGLDLLARIQTAHYVEGRRVSDRPVLVQLASDIGLNANALWKYPATADVQQVLQSVVASPNVRNDGGHALSIPGESENSNDPTDTPAFAAELQNWLGEPVERHIEGSRSLLHKAGSGGFPAFVLDNGSGLKLLSHSNYLGRPDDWQAFLKDQLTRDS